MLRWLKQFFSSSSGWERPKPIPLRMDFSSSSVCFIDHWKIGVVQFRGIAENSHERCHIYGAMDDVLTRFLNSERPAGLILDLRELEYWWGDQMAQTLALVHVDAPAAKVVVIVSDSNRQGMTSLVRDELFCDPSRWLVDDDEQAKALMQSILTVSTSKRRKRKKR